MLNFNIKMSQLYIIHVYLNIVFRHLNSYIYNNNNMFIMCHTFQPI